MESTNEEEAKGVEEEDTSAAGSPPFDPSKIRVRLWTPTIDLLMKRIKEGEIDLAPDFQRKAGIWKDKAQSQLIESLLLRIPLPAFFIWDSEYAPALPTGCATRSRALYCNPL